MNIKFNSKILLFGEYGVIKGSKGFAIPCEKYFGVLNTSKTPEHINEKLRLNDFCDYLDKSGILSKVLDLTSFKKDIEDGLFFESNIPLGHGVGSSGALCASIYHRYAFDFERKEQYSSDELKYLQDLMALMESYYHGTSSGLDCLISLIDSPVLIESRNDLKIVHRPSLKKLGHFYLYESGIVRKTAPLVHTFLNEFESNQNFHKSFIEFIKYTNMAIANLISGDSQEFGENFAKISRLQYLNFNQMIPDSVKSFWLEGLETKKFYVKLCGAGGGGFFLVYSQDGPIQANNLIELSH
jgi:mevalonate kinase